jgi:trk system potassium uptake protein TrkA
MGCGRVGSALSLRLIELGHSVAIIDKDESAFVALGDDFTGQKVLGVGFDRDTLIEAGIEKAQHLLLFLLVIIQISYLQELLEKILMFH